MKLIRIDEIGKQYQYNLPDLKAEFPEQEGQSSKQERINKMLEAQGKGKNKTDIDFQNYLEMGHIYATISGYEYIKMDLNEFWSFVNILNALASIDGIADNLATFYLLYGDVNLINTENSMYQSITAEEIREVAKKYLNPNQRVILDYIPTKEKAQN